MKWEDINMEFVVFLPRNKKPYDSIWVVVDRLTKSTRFIRFKSAYSAKDYVMIIIDEIVCCHGILLSIISNRCEEFTSRI